MLQLARQVPRISFKIYLDLPSSYKQKMKSLYRQGCPTHVRLGIANFFYQSVFLIFLFIVLQNFCNLVKLLTLSTCRKQTVRVCTKSTFVVVFRALTPLSSVTGTVCTMNNFSCDGIFFNYFSLGLWPRVKNN